MATEHKKSEEQLHYESLASYLKYTVGIAGSIIAVIVSVAIYFTYSDRESMRQAQDKLLTEFRTQMIDMKSDARITENQVKDEAKNDVKSAREYSQNELTRLQSETHKIALDETEKQISDIFKSDKIQSIIEKNAIGELKEKLPSTIADYTKRLPKILEAGALMKGGTIEGDSLLKSYFKSPSEFEREFSKSMYEDILNEYRNYYSAFTPKDILLTIKGMQVNLTELHPMVNNKYPANPADVKNLTTLIRCLNDPNFQNSNTFYGVAAIIKALAIISGKPFVPFEKDELINGSIRSKDRFYIMIHNPCSSDVKRRY